MAEHRDAPMCGAMSRPLVPGQPSSYMICTRDAGHKGNHTSCDGQGHVLAEWLRMPVERFWQPGGCDVHPDYHGGAR